MSFMLLMYLFLLLREEFDGPVERRGGWPGSGSCPRPRSDLETESSPTYSYSSSSSPKSSNMSISQLLLSRFNILGGN
jgi:hypothetical protein